MQPEPKAAPSPPQDDASTRNHAQSEPDARVGNEPGMLEEAARLYEEGRLTASAAQESLRAIKTLAVAEGLLARVALARAAFLLAGALCVAVVATLFVFATLAAGLAAAGLSWPLALAIPAVALALGTALLLRQGLAVLRLARFSNTREQVARLREMWT